MNPIVCEESWKRLSSQPCVSRAELQIESLQSDAQRGDVPEVTQHIRGTASTRIQVSQEVGSTLGLGTYWRTLACPFP